MELGPLGAAPQRGAAWVVFAKLLAQQLRNLAGRFGLITRRYEVLLTGTSAECGLSTSFP